MIKRNAVILAAGTASRFVPLSQECPKGLLDVKGEILIERQIRQLKEAGVEDICVVVGYKAEMFEYLEEMFGVDIVLNGDYARYNNTSSIIRVIERLDDTFVCSSDNYFPENIFQGEPIDSYYSALYANGDINEYCMVTDAENNIIGVDIGGCSSWYMVGHVYFNHEFSKAFRQIMISEYMNDEVRQGYWEDVYIRHINQLPLMKINRYKENEILEFDTIDELRQFDVSYLDDTRSSVIKQICKSLACKERDVYGFKSVKHSGDYLLFNFFVSEQQYLYNDEQEKKIIKL